MVIATLPARKGRSVESVEAGTLWQSKKSEIRVRVYGTYIVDGPGGKIKMIKFKRARIRKYSAMSEHEFLERYTKVENP
jgi:hypothetical protein